MKFFDIGNRWKIVLVATGFNLLFEYSMRGINNLPKQPVLPLILFAAYFTYFTMLEDLIVRFKLRDYHLILASFFFGTIYVCLVSGAAFTPPLILGINWGYLLFINLVWWGALQAVMTFYIANRLAPRDWNHPVLSKKGWGLMLILNGFIVLLFQLSGVIPYGNPVGIIVMSIILIATAFIFKKLLPSKDERAYSLEFKKIRLMDYLSIFTTTVFLVCAMFLIFDPSRLGASNVNLTAVRIVSVWTTILSIIMVAYRWYNKRPISI
ncbi:MAG: hypothetical protein QW279_07395 [Candidatus Jordarchaeaceae archaeon]